MHTRRQFGAAVLGLAALAMLLGGAGMSRADFMFSTPAGISPGQQFIVVFIDTTGGTAVSTKIADYNGDVGAAASGITYSGGTIGSWFIIGATATDDPAQALFASPLPVYNLNGGKLAQTGVDYLNAGKSPEIAADGTDHFGTLAWTGLAVGGGPFTDHQLGQSTVSRGEAGTSFNGSGVDVQVRPPTSGNAFYGYATFTAAPATTVVPEPSGITLALVGVVVTAAAHVARRRRDTPRG
jgi:hypothetical protein